MPRQVPIVDLAGCGGSRRATIAQQLTAAASDTGFFQVINHQIPQARHLAHVLISVVWLQAVQGLHSASDLLFL